MEENKPQELLEPIGQYRLLSLVGEGGMGLVYKAENMLLGRKVALKILHPDRTVRPEIVQRFFNEARVVNKIQHPNVVDIFDYSMTDDGRPYFVMELLNGKPLSQEIEAKGAFEISKALHIFRQIANALDACHKEGVIHRDLKPENILLLPKGDDPNFVKVLDFGIAKLQEGDGFENTQKTKTGMVLGTPAYMSPEQAGGKPTDLRTDIYSLGLILYEMLTGSQPYSAETASYLIVKILTEPIPSPRSRNAALSPLLEAVVLKALQKKQEDRFQTSAEFLRAIDEVVASGGGVALSEQQQKLFAVRSSSKTTLSGAIGEAKSAKKASSIAVWLGGASLVVAIAAIALSASSSSQAPRLEAVAQPNPTAPKDPTPPAPAIEKAPTTSAPAVTPAPTTAPASAPAVLAVTEEKNPKKKKNAEDKAKPTEEKPTEAKAEVKPTEEKPKPTEEKPKPIEEKPNKNSLWDPESEKK